MSLRDKAEMLTAYTKAHRQSFLIVRLVTFPSAEEIAYTILMWLGTLKNLG